MTPLERRLLILDDDVTVARTIGFVAQGLGFTVECVDASETFFDAVRSTAPTHIAIDLIMPGMDGVEVMRQLALMGCDAQVILTSGMGQKVLEAAQSTARERGLNIVGVLPKPFRPVTLRELLGTDPTPPGGRQAAATAAGAASPLTAELVRRAIAGQQITIAAQPKLALATGRVVGAEILARWRDRELGFVPPDAFVKVAEAAGMMHALTMLVLDQALDWFAGSPLQASGGSVAVNLSTSCLSDVVLADDFHAHCRARNVAPERLILEITESTAMDRTADTFDTLTRLRLKGFRLSLDDFGTGYSSLAQLARLPLSEIKIDRSFVSGMHTSADAHKIVDATIRLAQGMGLSCVAEGVEDEQTLHMLKQMGCEMAQGYLFSRPLPVGDFDDWLQARR